MNDVTWTFPYSPNQATITTIGVMNGDHFVDFVSHDEDDGGWQFLCQVAGPLKMDDALLVSLEEAVSTVSSLLSLADLPIGWCARRSNASEAWSRAQSDV